MNASKFDTVVKNRAQEKVKARVDLFRSDISNAFKALFDGVKIEHHDHYYNWLKNSDVVKQCFANCIRDRENPLPNAWPKELWEHEQEVVTKQLLSIMDEMQKALIAPAPSEDGPKPVGGEQKETT